MNIPIGWQEVHLEHTRPLRAHRREKKSDTTPDDDIILRPTSANQGTKCISPLGAKTPPEYAEFLVKTKEYVETTPDAEIFWPTAADKGMKYISPLGANTPP